MNHFNIEIKAKSSEEEQEKIKKILLENKAKFIGLDRQTDTYFKVDEIGRRLKIRIGKFEKSLIDYSRKNDKDLKESTIKINTISYDLMEKIRKTHLILVEVKKNRGIYFIGNVKFHIDEVDNLGNFIEIEAIFGENSNSKEKLKKQCEYYKNLFEIKNENLISESYSDLLLKNNGVRK